LRPTWGPYTPCAKPLARGVRALLTYMAMNWLTDFIRPRIRSFVAPKDVPGDLWSKCPACEGMLFAPDLKTSHNVCTHCGHHLRMPVKDRLALLFDGRCYKTIAPPSVPDDPLRFRDRRRYTERLREARAATGLRDAITIAHGTIAVSYTHL